MHVFSEGISSLAVVSGKVNIVSRLKHTGTKTKEFYTCFITTLNFMFAHAKYKLQGSAYVPDCLTSGN